MARNRAGSEPRSALNIGVLNNVRRFRGSLSVESGADQQLNAFYRFRLNSASDITLTLNKLQNNADLWLRGGDGGSEVLGRSRRQGRRNERITLEDLAAGIYFIQVGLQGARTPYTLTASPSANPPGETPTPPGEQPFPVAITPVPDPGSVPSTAFNVGSLSGRSAFRDTVGGTDDADLYRFNVTRSSRVIISTVDIVGGSLETQLIYDINGNDLIDTGDVIETNNNITKGLGAGTYFVRVSPTTGTNVSYVLRFDESAITNLSPSTDPPLGLGGASNLGVLRGALSIRQIVSTSDRNNPSLVGTFDSTDIYRFTLTDEVSNFSALLNTTQLTGNVTMSLIYDENGNGIANPGALSEEGFVILGDFPGGVFTGGSGGGAALAINKTLGQGTYYLAVTQREVTDNTTYNIDLFSNAISGVSTVGDPTNTSIPTAFNLGVLNQNVSFKQFVGSSDDSDFYTFTLDQTRNIIIRYNGTPELTGIRFGKDFNGNGVFDPFEDINDNRILDPGEDLNGNGILDLAEDINRDGQLNPGEDVNGNGRLDQGEDVNNNGFLDPSEDINGNGVLDRDVFQPSLTGDVVYSPLPPFFNQEATFNTTLDTFLTPGIPTDVYARLSAGTYVIQINRQAIQTDLGDSLTRYGSANVLYNLSFIVEPPVA